MSNAAYKHIWYEAHKQETIAKASLYNATHQEKRRATTQRYRETHREELREASRNRAKANPSRTTEYANKRRAIKEASFIEEVDRQIVTIRDQGICQIGECGLPVDPNLRWPHPMSISIDHIIPLSKGGEHSYKNVQLSHLTCNWKKGIKV